MSESAKLTCWEFKKCGREPNGLKVDEFGVCPAAVADSNIPMNDTCGAGRSCWTIANTFCDNKVQGIFASKLVDCMVCDFFKEVKKEEGKDFVLFRVGKVNIPIVR
ncbi:MAG: hypothetical protein OEZ01_12690 [Candidatus Heimdallarchaeota archaeon]|nr:hypothetical protein [Candidatus Heimdallarchaeota archaeon]MDH5646863.1 hypothetical protein [Candidatus Heimdallarchaeota archaeon]